MEKSPIGELLEQYDVQEIKGKPGGGKVKVGKGKNKRWACSDGEYWNRKKEKCVPCAAGKAWSNKKNACVKNPCKDGQKFNPDAKKKSDRCKKMSGAQKAALKKARAKR